MLSNASHFPFTATPKNKTLEIFGEPWRQGEVGKHRPFHSYTMKRAIDEGFILDVLEHFTPVESYFRLAKTVATTVHMVESARGRYKHQQGFGFQTTGEPVYPSPFSRCDRVSQRLVPAHPEA